MMDLQRRIRGEGVEGQKKEPNSHRSKPPVVALRVFASHVRPRLSSVVNICVKQMLGNCEWSIEP